MRVWTLMVGRECPECGREIDADSLRYEGWAWTHRSEEANAGHHAFDALEAVGVEPTGVGFVPTELHTDPAGNAVLVGEVALPDGFMEGAEE